jgi:hypothetical protein
MYESNVHSASAAARSFVDHNAAFCLYVGNGCYQIVYQQSYMLDALAVLGNVFADWAIIVFGDVYQELD